MSLAYISGIIYLFILSKSKNTFVIQLSLLTILSLIVFFFSIRSSPDEYARYLELAVPDRISDFEFTLSSEWAYNLIGLFSKQFPDPRLVLYFITYSLTFSFIAFGLRMISNRKEVIALCLAYYFSHNFVSLAYEGLRGGLGNSICIFSICHFIKYKNSFVLLGTLFLAISIHIQTLPFAFVLFVLWLSFFIIPSYFKTLKVKQYKYLFSTLLVIVILFAVIYRSDLANVVINYVLSLASLERFVGYLSSEYHTYEIDLLGAQYFSSLLSNVLILVLSFPILLSNMRFHKWIFYLLLIGQCISLSLSSLALLAFRFSSPFYSMQIPLIAALLNYYCNSLRIGEYGRFKISNTRNILIASGLALTFYNVFIKNCFKEYII